MNIVDGSQLATCHAINLSLISLFLISLDVQNCNSLFFFSCFYNVSTISMLTNVAFMHVATGSATCVGLLT